MPDPRRVQGIPGIPLPRPATPLAQGGVRSLYTIAGGMVRLVQIFGVVTTAVAATANATKLQFKPTGQTAIDLCATADINGLIVGQVVGITGTAANALVIGYGFVAQATPWMVGPGTLDMNCVASVAGAMRWGLLWVPVDPGAVVSIT
jgi:hypothetical protein